MTGTWARGVECANERLCARTGPGQHECECEKGARWRTSVRACVGESMRADMAGGMGLGRGGRARGEVHEPNAAQSCVGLNMKHARKAVIRRLLAEDKKLLKEAEPRHTEECVGVDASVPITERAEGALPECTCADERKERCCTRDRDAAAS